MEKVIVLKGGSDNGKTTTLNLLIDLFQIVADHYEIKFNPENWEDEKDRWAYFDFCKKRIGICTSGDSAKTIKNNFKYFEDNQCDIAVCASHVWDESGKAMNKKLKKLDADYDTWHKTKNNGTAQEFAAVIFKNIIKELNINFNFQK
ncbi:MAG: hypothetical protein MR911_06265 [Spirochaetia bacterium]|nr:hypothetical protein [Spirochaetia bacterium]